MKNKKRFGLTSFGLVLMAALSFSLVSQARSKRSDAPSNNEGTGSSYGSTVSDNSLKSKQHQNGSSDYSDSEISGMRDETVTGSSTSKSKKDKRSHGTTGSAVNSGTNTGNSNYSRKEGVPNPSGNQTDSAGSASGSEHSDATQSTSGSGH